jgi:hypothetical protein
LRRGLWQHVNSMIKLSKCWVFIRDTEVGCNFLTECRQTPTRNSPRKFSWPWRISLMKECWVSHSVWREPFAPKGHPQTRERGGRSPEGGQPPRRKHPQVEKKEDTVGRVTVINGAMSTTLMG